MRWRTLGIGLFIAGTVLIGCGLVQDLSVRQAPTPKIVALSAQVKDCATKFDDLTNHGLTQTRAHEAMRACDVALANSPGNCSAFLSAAGRAGFTAEQGIGTGRASDLEPYEASRRDAIASRRQCSA
jgi:hypothetical protein